jgi:branched-subunit amino acid transport protein
MTVVWIFVVGGFASWLLRVAFIALVPSGHPPEAVVRLLRYAAPAAFASLVAAAVDSASTGDGPLAGWAVVVATGITLFVAWRFRHVLLTLVTGAVSVTALTFL